MPSSPPGKPKPETGSCPKVGDRDGARILVVDDDPELAEFLAEVLGSYGHAPKVTYSGEAALELLAGSAFDLIFLDCRMPGMSGRQFFEELRALNPELARRVVFVTGDTASVGTRDFVSSTGNAHLSKPFRIEQVDETVRAALGTAAGRSRQAGASRALDGSKATNGPGELGGIPDGSRGRISC